MTIQIDFATIDTLRKGVGGKRVVRTRDNFRILSKTYPDKKKILAEGDSWFAYPPKFILFGAASNVVDWLKKKHSDTLLIDDISSNGDEAVAMLSGDSKLEFLRRINEDHFDMLLFSGGGNDIVGRYDFDYFLLPKTTGNTWEDCINRGRFQRRLEMVERAYADLVELVVQYSENPNIQIVTHTYDIPIPSKDGATFFGGLLQVDKGRSWMYPYLMDKGISDSSDQCAIAQYMLTEFKGAINRVAVAADGRLKIVDTQGTVEHDEWVNEIHPNSEGFEKVAEKFFEEGIKPLT
jgi:hypothetical protein